MELRQVEHFIAVAEERHFTRAARRLHIVQSGLSASIRALEQELNAALFVRSTRRVELTDAGRVFLMEARRVLAAVEEARNAVAAVQGLMRGTLTIGSLQSLPTCFDLPAVLLKFRVAHPQVEIRLHQAAPDELLAALRGGRLDLALVALAAPPTPHIVLSTLVREPLVLACSPDHPLAAGSEVELRDLESEPFIDFPDGWTTRVLIDRVFAQAQQQRKTAFVVNDVASLLTFVARGLGVAVVPKSLVSLSDDVRGVALRDVGVTWNYGVARAAGRPLSPAAQAFFDLVQGSCGSAER